MKKTSRIIAGAAAAVITAGCSGGGEQDEQQHVTLWMYPVLADEAAHKAHWDDVVAEFEAAYDNIKVDYEIFPWANRDEALQTAISSNTAPDLVYLIPDQLAAYRDAIEPMGEYLTDAKLGDLHENVIESVTLGGEMLGAPLLTTANSLLCNATAFEAAGVDRYPETWDDVLDMAPKFVENDMYAISYDGSADMTLNMSFYPLLWQAGGSVYGEDGEAAAFNSAAGVEALEFLVELNDMGALEPDVLTTSVPLEQTALAQGKVGCTWNVAIADIGEFWDDEEIVVLAPLTNKETISYGTVGSLVMLKNAEDKDAAGLFADFATNGDVVVPYLKEAGFFSAVASTGEMYADDPLLAAVEANIPTATVGELYATARELQGVILPEIQAALLGQKAVQEALDDAATAAAPLLSN